MTHHCLKCSPPVKLIYQPAKRRYYCPACHRNYTRREAVFLLGGKQ